MENPNKRFKGKKMLFILPIVLFALGVLGLIIMLLWNAILPELLEVKEITYWQALGLFVLCKLLFGGFRFGGGPGRFSQGRKWREKFANMSDEERQVLKEKWKQKCGNWNNE
jgi:Ca2+/H+ antiporter, TMEM165/GDT1 family